MLYTTNEEGIVSKCMAQIQQNSPTTTKVIVCGIDITDDDRNEKHVHAKADQQLIQIRTKKSQVKNILFCSTGWIHGFFNLSISKTLSLKLFAFNSGFNAIPPTQYLLILFGRM